MIRLLETEGRDCGATVKFFDRELGCTVSHHSLVTLTEQGERMDLLEDVIRGEQTE